MFVGPVEREFAYFCISTDTKKTTNIEPYSVLYETDTGKKYYFSGNAWNEDTNGITVASLPLPSGAATSAKQLADNHQVTVSNIASTPVITGFATAANQGKFNGATSGLVTWKEVDGKPRVSSMSYLYDIAEGNVTGHESWSKIGYNGDVDAGTEDMIGQGGVYTFPAVEGSMDIVSSSAEDDPDKPGAGTGIHTVTLYYLDDEFTEKSVDINLNGTVAVETSVSDIYRVQNMRAKVCGTGGAAAGNITLSEHGGATYKYGHILTGNIRMRQCVYTVPKNKVLYIAGISFAVGGAAKEKCAVFTTLAKYDNKALAIRTFFLPYNEVIIEDNAYHRELEIPTKLPAGVDFKVQVKGLVADCVCTCSLRGWMETA